jgi:O-antigen/teichoic acid export membrane protein
LNIEDRIGVYNKYQMIGSTVNSITQDSLIMGAGVGVIGVFISKIFWQAIIAIGGIKDLLKRKTLAVYVDYGKYKDLVIKGGKMHLNMIGALMLTNIDIIMVSAYLGNKETGIYQLAVQTSLMMMTVPYAVMTILQGEVTRKGVHGIWGHQKKLLFLTLGFMIGAAIITSLTAQWWLIWLAGEEFREAITVFKYLTIWVVVSTATAILSVQWIARGLFLQLSTASIFTGIMNIVLNAIFIPKYGMMGAVWATMGTAVVALVINIGMFIWVERDVRRQAELGADMDNAEGVDATA